MTHTIHTKDVPPQHVVSARRHVPFATLGDTFSEAIGSIFQRLAPAGKWPTGAPFAIYYNQPCSPEDVDIEIAVPVAPDVALEDEAVTLRTHDLPGARVAFTVHTGPYAELGTAYDDVYAWLREHGYEPAGPPREIYLVGPTQAQRPSDLVTEIDVPLR